MSKPSRSDYPAHRPTTKSVVQPATVKDYDYNLKQAAQLISEITWRFITTHSREEVEAVRRQVEQRRAARHRLFPPPVPLDQREGPGSGE